MESNIFTIIGNRMKHNRTSWSVAGANNLAVLLALHHTGQLRTVLRYWDAGGSPSTAYTVTAPLSAGTINRPVNGDYVPPHTIYFDCLPDWAKDCLGFQPFSELKLLN